MIVIRGNGNKSHDFIFQCGICDFRYQETVGHKDESTKDEHDYQSFTYQMMQHIYKQHSHEEVSEYLGMSLINKVIN